MVNDNKALNRSRSAIDNDEFYTLYSDIESEVRYYHNQLKGKIVYCNCDNPIISNFVQYFIRNFNKIGLKRLIVSCLHYPTGYTIDISSVPVDIASAPKSKLIEWIIPHIHNLSGNGGFQAPECINLLKKCDIVITNPPFSLFRIWYDLVKANRKRFLVLANMNTCLSANISEDIIENRCRFGCETVNREYSFTSPSGAIRKIRYICWLTNMQTVSKPFIPTIYRPISEYETYDGQNVLKIPKITEIPARYNGVMGVPTSFLFKHNPAQFKIVGIAKHGKDNRYDLFIPRLHGKDCYTAILIQKR